MNNDREQVQKLSKYNETLIGERGSRYVFADFGSKPDISSMVVPTDRKLAKPIITEVENGNSND